MTRSLWINTMLAAAVALAPIAAIAADMPQMMLTTKLGWVEAKPDMFRSPNDAMRAMSPSGFYAATGDFDGDGKADEARMLINRDGKQAMLVIVLKQPNYKMRTFGFTPMKASLLGVIGIKVAVPGTYTLARPEGGVTTKSIGNPGLIMFRYGGAARLYTFAGDDFITTDIVDNDPVTLASAEPAK